MRVLASEVKSTLAWARAGDGNEVVGFTAAAFAVLRRTEAVGYVRLGFQDCLYMSAGIGLRAGYPLQ